MLKATERLEGDEHTDTDAADAGILLRGTAERTLTVEIRQVCSGVSSVSSLYKK
jgi:hypothetical protein